MKIVESRDRLSAQLSAARSEAQAGFNNPNVYLERYVSRPRHIEVQVLGDGDARDPLGERECSIQRRHQKLASRRRPGRARRRAPRQAARHRAQGHRVPSVTRPVGTLEFLLDEDKNFYFMEMNTRIQVEHTVTEEVFGVDLVREQMKLAAERAACRPATSGPAGHAIELRINAEDPVDVSLRRRRGRSPPSTCRRAWASASTRHYLQRLRRPATYDSLLGQAHRQRAENRPACPARLRCRALAEFAVEGCKDQPRTSIAACSRIPELHRGQDGHAPNSPSACRSRAPRAARGPS